MALKLRAAAPPYIPLMMRSKEVEEPPFPMTELPNEVTALVLSKLSSSSDVVAMGLSSRAMLRQLADASLAMSLTTPGKSASMTSAQATSFVAAVSASLSKYMPGLTSLDLSGLLIDDADVLRLCSGLPCLRALGLSGCKRLTTALCDALAGTNSPAPRLLVLDMQRCFQLHSGCVRALVRAQGGRGAKLQCLGFSHLDLGQLQLEGPAPLAARCLEVDGATEAATASANGTAGDGEEAGEDEALPGSPGDARALEPVHPVLDACPPSDLQQPRAALPLDAGASLRMLSLHNSTHLSTRLLLQLAAACPRLTLLLLGGSSLTPSHPAAPGSLQDLGDQLQGALLRGAGPHGLLEVLHESVEACPQLQEFTGPPAARQNLSLAAVGLAATALALPDLQALELSFMSPAVAPAVTHALEAARGALGRGAVPQVWDLTLEPSVNAALAMLHAARRADPASCAQPAVAHLTAALKCAVNCSSSSRTTPLHSAAFVGAAGRARKLLELGAAVDARAVGGGTALFLAAEAGHAGAVGVLLAAGGDPSISNTQGESPLYIAALRGHLDVVRLLVEGFARRRMPWYELRFWPDGWTPLMAAALANHYNVAQWLLAAAGAEAAPMLVAAANRYGQSVLHIAARKGSTQMLKLLLCASGASALAVPDASGETPIDVAIRHCHTVAVAEFKRVRALAAQ